jgi:hypothetical protein
MGEIADMMLDGLLDEETGEYIGDRNKRRFGHAAPGFPVSYEREQRESRAKKVTCSQCGRRVKAAGLKDHVRDKHAAPQEGGES